MSTVKITDLPVISSLDANTGNTIIVGVDLPTDTTGRISATVLADGLYENKALKVGLPDIIFPNVIAQFAGSGDPYLQVNAQNTDANNSVDYVATADIGTNANNFIDMGINNSLYEDEEFSAQSALDGYLYVHGSVNSSSDGNLIIGTASAGANVVFAVGGQRLANVVATLSRYGLSMNGASYIKFSDDSIQSVAAAPANYTQSAFDAANTAAANTIVFQGINDTQNTRLNSIETVNVNQNTSISIIQGVNDTQNTRLNSIETVNTDQNTAISIIQGVNLTQNTNITTANNHAWAAFDKANNALANTTGTFAGSLNITNDLTTNGIITFANSTFAATQALATLTASNNSLVQAPNGDGYVLHLSGKYNVPTRLVSDSFGANGQICFPAFVGRAARGNVAYPSASQSGDILARFGGTSYGTTQYQLGGSARIDIVASENHTDAARGSQIKFYNIANGGNTVQQIASFNANTAEFFGAVEPQKGFVYTANTYPSSQTAISISFADGPVYRAQTSAGLVVTLTNFYVGKAVELWVTNTAGTGQTFTHGVSAVNSTVNSTTYNIPATSTIYAKYYCLDGTLSNTFVAITHA